jgi:hypothetical protein
LPDLERRAVTKFRLSLSEFWDSTPRELDLLMEASAYNDEFEMNKIRHIIVTHVNLSRKKGALAKKPSDIMYLPLIDGKRKSESEVKAELDKLKQTLAKVKENW